jgi:hypothetical protein
MFQPRLADLFKAVIVGRAPAHPIKILRDDWVICVSQREPI